jgi:hypothetical protein
MQARLFRAALFALASALPLWAAAHTGADAGAHHPAGFLDGLVHPLAGPDHLAAMLAVGCWSALTARRIWLAPLAFAAMLLVGALMGLAGLNLPAVEPVIAASLLVLGLLVAARTQLPATAAAYWWAHSPSSMGWPTAPNSRVAAMPGCRWQACCWQPSACTSPVSGSATPCASATCGGRGWQEAS